MPLVSQEPGCGKPDLTAIRIIMTRNLQIISPQIPKPMRAILMVYLALAKSTSGHTRWLFSHRMNEFLVMNISMGP